MERLKKNLILLAALFAVVGAGAQYVLYQHRMEKHITEKELVELAPMEWDNFKMQKAPDDDRISYKMDETTYNVLKPHGIVARVVENATEKFDVVVIASNDTDSFHDPHVCFTAQGFEFAHESTEMVQTKTRGEVPITFTRVKNKDQDLVAAYFYKDPTNKFHAGTTGLAIAMLKDQIVTLKRRDAVFYRVIALSPEMTKDQFLEFVGRYLDVANEKSKGYF